MSEAECLTRIEVEALGRANSKLREENNQLRARCHQYRRQADDALAECRSMDRAERVIAALKTTGMVIWNAAGVAVFFAALTKLGAWLAYIFCR